MDKIAEIINYYSETESHSVDFKLTQYPIERHEKKNEFLKDISAMANHLSGEDKYIIIGVKRKKTGDLKFQNVINPIDQASYQQFLDSNIEPQLNFEYITTDFEEHQIAYFKIFDNNQRPYLLKKNVRNPIDPDKIDYKKGDGFIRVGTSTNKMIRDDFERIYEKRFQQRDRKSDIKITPFISALSDEEFAELVLNFFDFNIENSSNQSIDLDVELKIFKCEEITFVPKYKLENELTKENRGMFPSPVINSAFSHVHFENFGDYIKVSRTKLRTEKSAVHIAQNDTEEEVFTREILVHKEGELSIIKAELVIRSDKFTDGALTRKIELEI